VLPAQGLEARRSRTSKAYGVERWSGELAQPLKSRINRSRAVSIEHNYLGYLLLAATNEQDGHIEQARIAYAEAQRLSPEISSPEMRDALQLADELLPHHSPSESAYTGATPGFVAGR
jgi:hypothetical protein